MVLVLTLAVLTLITAMVVEFARGVYINTESLYNWQASKRLSLLAKSGVNIASKLLADNLKETTYTYPGSIVLPPVAPVGKDGFGDTVAIRIEDENSKFNLNTLLYENGMINEDAYEGFRRLLDGLELDDDIAPRVADWLDRDDIPRLEDSDTGLKNSRMEVPDELLLIPGIESAGYEKLKPYITVYGSGLININGAEAPVLMTLDDSITVEMAGRITGYRELKPFDREGQITSVAGFEKLGISLMGRITVKGSVFSIHSTASSGDGIKRTVTCVLDSGGRIKYWKEI